MTRAHHRYSAVSVTAGVLKRFPHDLGPTWMLRGDYELAGLGLASTHTRQQGVLTDGFLHIG